MKRLSISFFVLLLMTASLFAQTKPAARPTSEQSLQELVTEVRQLRATLQRMNASVYKGQVLLEQVKLQQEQVSRMSRELRDARDALSDMRAQESRIREHLSRVATDVDAGTKDPSEKANLKAEFDYVTERRHRLMMRESQLANELEIERAKLNELNDKLNLLLEQELSPR
jgi:myosin heavy subunit